MSGSVRVFRHGYHAVGRACRFCYYFGGGFLTSGIGGAAEELVEHFLYLGVAGDVVAVLQILDSNIFLAQTDVSLCNADVGFYAGVVKVYRLFELDYRLVVFAVFQVLVTEFHELVCAVAAGEEPRGPGSGGA